MPNAAFSSLADRLKAAGRITADDTLAMRALVYGEVDLTADEAAAIVALDEAIAERAPEWDDFFVEALVDYVVHEQAPRDYVDAAKAAWLMGALTHEGRIKTDSGLEALVRILELATETPPDLSAFALAQVKDAIVEGEGPLLRGGRLEKGRVTAGEVELLRRLLYAAGGDGNTAITRAEAEALLDINDACRGGDNDPSWTDLFAKALAASVMTVSGWRPQAREDELRREVWLRTPEKGAFDFIGRLFAAAPAGVRGFGHRHVDEETQLWSERETRFEAAEAAAEPVTDDEARWLAARIGREGQYDAAERALIDFLRHEAPAIAPALRPLLDAAPPAGAPPAIGDAPVFGHRCSLPA